MHVVSREIQQPSISTIYLTVCSRQICWVSPSLVGIAVQVGAFICRDSGKN